MGNTKETDKKQEKPIGIQKETPSNTTRKLSFKEKREMEELEIKVIDLQELKEKLTEEISKQGQDFETIQKISLHLENTIQELEEKEMRWLELSLLNED